MTLLECEHRIGEDGILFSFYALLNFVAVFCFLSVEFRHVSVTSKITVQVEQENSEPTGAGAIKPAGFALMHSLEVEPCMAKVYM